MVYQQIKNNYKGIDKHLNRYRKEMEKQMNIKSSIVFLIRCRKSGITPNFIKNATKNINNIFKDNESLSESLNKTLTSYINKFHSKILNLLIKHKHNIKKHNTREMIRIKSTIDGTLSTEDANMLYTCEKTLERKKRLEIRTRHKRKFNVLQQKLRKELDIKENSGWFVNKTRFDIPENVEWLLSHGKKFSVPQKKEEFPLLKYIADGEECVKTLDDKEDQEIARNKLTYMVENFMNKQQLNSRDKYTIRTMGETKKFLKENSEIIIVEADKGNVTVAMERKDYEERMNTIVYDMMTYRRLTKDPTNTLQKKNNDLVDELFTHNIISEVEKKKMKTDIAIAPRIYGLPKIHKPDFPLRPICSSINSPSYQLSRYLTSILSRLTENSKYNIKNSVQFKDKIQNTVIDDDEMMVSFDVVSLFPSIPVDLALNIIEKKWTKLSNYTKMTKPLFLKILKFCIQENRYFKYKENIYQQKRGLPMGSSASPVVADIVMEELLDNAINNCDIRPKILTKYVDDLFGIIKTSAIGNVLTNLNSFNQYIKFTIEEEAHQKLPYLDTIVIRNNGKLKLNWYQKPSASGRLINFHSKHPKRMIINTALNFIKRVLTISDEEFHADNKIIIKAVLTQNSFPMKTINSLLNKNKAARMEEKPQVIYKSVIYVPKLSERFEKSNCIDMNLYRIAPKTNNTLQQLFSNLKTKVDNMEKSNVIYKIQCNGNEKEDCDKCYIGTTKNKLKTRIAGHKSDIKKRNDNTTARTALTAHCATKKHHPQLERVQVLQTEHNYSKRLTLEMLHILSTTTQHRMNFKTDTDNLAQSYRTLMKKSRRSVE